MNKLEAADKLAQSASHLLGDNDQASPAWDEVSQALLAYRQAPAMPSAERILEAMEILVDNSVGPIRYSEALDTLSELRKALRK